jgi:hypothetical protein
MMQSLIPRHWLWLGFGVAAAVLVLARLRPRRAQAIARGNSNPGASQTGFDRSGKAAAPAEQAIFGAQISDRDMADELTAPSGYGPAPGGYGPASSPAGAHGGAGTFGAEGAGGGPGNAFSKAGPKVPPPDDDTPGEK